jgi:uncharacterized repeat protein (TIGR01451 family)
MYRKTWLVGAWVLGLAVVAAVMGGLQMPSHAADTEAGSAEARDVVINEVAWMGTDASSSDEWIELYNATDSPIDIEQWSIFGADSGACLNFSDADGSITTTIPAHGYLIYGNDEVVVTDTGGISLVDIWDPTMEMGNSTTDPITLYDGLGCTGNVVDTANADGGDWPAGTSSSGSPSYASMERIDPTAPDSDDNWATNDGVTRNGFDADGNPINGTPKARNSSYAAPGLTLAKQGPPIATAGLTLTGHILVSNTAHMTSVGVVVTDVLPAGLTFVTQTSRFTFEQVAPRTLRWDVGDLTSATLDHITLTLWAAEDLSGTVTNVATATEQSGRTDTDSWSAPVAPYVRLYALAPGNYGGSYEAAALINQSPYTASVGGWWLNDEAEQSGLRLPSDASIGPERILWLAESYHNFDAIWGFAPDHASWAYWPGFTDHGEAAYLLDADGDVIDALAYGDGTASRGWRGDAVPYPYRNYAAGQVLYRKLDQATGRPVPDTDTAADWAQDPDDPINGRKVRYPGWDLETFFAPAVVTPTTPITLTTAPDGAFELAAQTFGAAQESIVLEGYTVESVALYDVLAERLQAGVAITMLLEGTPVGWFGQDRSNGLWVAEQIHQHPNGAVYFLYGDAPRYRYQHAKFAIVDGETALVSTENFNPSAMPSDRKDNGTMGHRGFVAVAESRDLAAHLRRIFAHDLDLAHHADLVPYGTHPLVLDDPGFVPLPEPDWTTYTAAFSQPLATTASDFAVIQSPENALRDRDGLLGLLGRVGRGDVIAAMQLNEPYTWTAGAGEAGLNPRPQALIAAARRGADVRLLLDSFYDDGSNETTCRRLNARADAEGLSLTCRLGNPTGSGVHGKVFLARVGDERWVHLGSINGSENANKNNREVALQFRSPAGYAWMMDVFEHDWALARPPYVAHLYLPVLMRGYIGPADYPLITEVFVNPGGADTGGEWIELYNSGATANIAGWTLGDASAAGDYGDGRYVFPEDAELLPRQVMVVAQCAQRFAEAQGQNPQYELAICPEGYGNDEAVPDLAPAGTWDGFGLALGNVADEVLLTESDGVIVDSVAWGGEQRVGVAPYPIDAGDTFPWDVALKRYPPDTDSDHCGDDFYISYNPSPGYVAAP